MNLTELAIRNLKDPGKKFDGQGLYIEVNQAGAKYWRLKYWFAGKEKRISLGVYPEVSLKQARELAFRARLQIQDGEDPSQLKQQTKARVQHEARNTLKAVAQDWLTHQSAKWEDITRERIWASLENHVFPALGNRALASIKPIEVKHAVAKIEKAGSADTAARVLQRIKAVYRWAVVHERIDTNPMLDLVPSEMLKPHVVTHRPALEDHQLPEFLNKLDRYGGDPHTVGAMRLLLLTAVRPGEVRGARWSEFDLEHALWTIPAERMKMRQEHRVPLSSQALELLQHIQGYTGGLDLVFPSPFKPKQPLSENTLNGMLRRMGYEQETAHGFRALFSTVANESGWNPDVIERQLAHVERNQVRAAYHRSTYMEERARLMQWWADYLDGKRSGKVARFKPRRA